MTLALTPVTVTHMTTTPVKTTETHTAHLAWAICRCCGERFYAPATQNVDPERMARRFGFMSRVHVAAYVYSIKAL